MYNGVPSAHSSMLLRSMKPTTRRLCAVSGWTATLGIFSARRLPPVVRIVPSELSRTSTGRSGTSTRSLRRGLPPLSWKRLGSVSRIDGVRTLITRRKSSPSPDGVLGRSKRREPSPSFLRPKLSLLKTRPPLPTEIAPTQPAPAADRAVIDRRRPEMRAPLNLVQIDPPTARLTPHEPTRGHAAVGAPTIDVWRRGHDDQIRSTQGIVMPRPPEGLRIGTRCCPGGRVSPFQALRGNALRLFIHFSGSTSLRPPCLDEGQTDGATISRRSLVPTGAGALTAELATGFAEEVFVLGHGCPLSRAKSGPMHVRCYRDNATRTRPGVRGVRPVGVLARLKPTGRFYISDALRSLCTVEARRTRTFWSLRLTAGV